MNLLPYPRSLVRRPGICNLSAGLVVQFTALPSPNDLRPIRARLESGARAAGIRTRPSQPRPGQTLPLCTAHQNAGLRRPQEYKLQIAPSAITIEFGEPAGLRAAVATLRQLWREYGQRLPCLQIHDWPDFERRGVMLDVSRGRVPKLTTLLELVDHLADFKINEFQLYFEHTFAYRRYRAVWRDWSALTASEIRRLDARCRELGIDLVPNQNSFGHLRYFLEDPRLKPLAEVSEPYEAATGDFVRRPSTLAPNHPDTLRFLRELYDELLPNFSSRFFNVGCDETWDLGRGQSRELCERLGKGRVYLDFLKKIHREVSRRGRRMMFWGDIILHYPDLIPELPRDVIALNWGYEANHPFEQEAAQFAKAGIPFYVCPGTSTWMSLLGRHDNAFVNLRAAARAGRRHGALGYLITDWGDGGHPQPLAVSYAPFLLGAALSWCEETADERRLAPVLSRDVFHDPTGRIARAALALGFAHRRFNYFEPNFTPFGAVIAAPPPELRELFCRHGLKYYARIPARRVRAALAEVEKQRAVLRRARPAPPSGKVLQLELDLACRMAAESCHYMLWQQALAAGNTVRARQLARRGIRALQKIERDFNAYWPLRNKGTTAKCSPFLGWRIEDYRRGVLHFPPEVARQRPTPRPGAAA
ncbi:MAG: family 20 glycosylhydrolase [Verrucomicrobiae bacterium]|nr:family 20 glycosylhydrolase [Verrucomicrobiae bacterium]